MNQIQRNKVNDQVLKTYVHPSNPKKPKVVLVVDNDRKSNGDLKNVIRSQL